MTIFILLSQNNIITNIAEITLQKRQHISHRGKINLKRIKLYD